MLPRYLLPLTASALAPLAAGQSLYIPESSNDTVIEVSAVDGSLINATFLDLAALTGGAASTPIEAIFTEGGEIWVTDQIADTVFRISGDGSTLLGTATTPLDNMRGGAVFGANALIANSGSNNGAPGDSLVELDPAGGLVGSTAIGDPFDAEPFTFNGVPGFLVSDISNEDIVFAEAANLANQTIFHDSDGISGIDFPEQVYAAADGTVWAAGFSAPSGLYQYDATGAQIQYIDTSALGFGGLRGVRVLGNGNLLFTNGSGIHVYDTAAGTVSTVVSGVSARFISGEGDGGLGSNYCSANPNSTGATSKISATGSASVASNDVTLLATDLPLNATAYFLTSQTQGLVMNPGGSQGNLCLGGSIGRYVGPGQVLDSGAGGEVSLAIDLTQTPQPTGLVSVQPGETWNFQCWHRDAVGGAATSNLTDGLEILFQ